MACEFFDRYERLTGVHLDHIHFVCGQDVPDGKEVEGLVPGRKLRPDAYDEKTKVVWLFHGEWYHGYPAWHPKHDSIVARGMSSKTQWQKTVHDMQAYKDAGYQVKYILSEEYIQTTVSKCPRLLKECIRDF